jgi:multidrug transporter EmrE-like cation transporter
MRWAIWAGYFLTLLFSLGGQILLKRGLALSLSGERPGFMEFLSHRLIPIFLAWPPLALLGLACCGAGMASWLFVLSQADLSRALPILGGLAYLLLFILGRFLLKEETTGLQFLGILLIFAGIYFLSPKGAHP